MHVFCPSCQKRITLSESMAGLETSCPWCQHRFRAPELLTPAPVAASASPAPTPVAVVAEPVPSAPTPPAAPAASMAFSLPAAPPAPPPPPRPPARPGEVSLVLERDLVRWFAPVGLTLALVLLFLPWVGAYPGGYGVYTQSGWQAIWGSMSEDAFGDTIVNKASALKIELPGSLPMFGVLVGLLLGVALAWADWWKPALPGPLPLWAQRFWPQRKAIVGVMAGAVILLLGMPLLTGFSLETAAYRWANRTIITPATTPIPPATTVAAPAARQEQKTVIEIGSKVAELALARSWWLVLATLAIVVAGAGAGLETWLERRGDRPAPELALRW